MKSYIILFVPKICSFATHERIVIFGTEKELNVPQGTVHSFYSKWTVRFFRKGLSFFQDKKGWLVVFSGPVKMGGGGGGYWRKWRVVQGTDFWSKNGDSFF